MLTIIRIQINDKPMKHFSSSVLACLGSRLILVKHNPTGRFNFFI